MSARATDARYNGGSAVDNGGSALDSGGSALDSGGSAVDSGGSALDHGGSALDSGGSEDRRWEWGPDYGGTEVMVVGVSKEWGDYLTLDFYTREAKR